jgi:hypothetical protein
MIAQSLKARAATFNSLITAILQKGNLSITDISHAIIVQLNVVFDQLSYKGRSDSSTYPSKLAYA